MPKPDPIAPPALPSRPGRALPEEGGACGRLLREKDWTGSPLGAPADWPPLLFSTVVTMINAPVPKVLMWGEDNRLLYNDGYAEICGQRHPAAFGATAREMWPEVWDWNRDVVRACGEGRSLTYLDQPLTLLRNGVPEETFFNFYYWPLRDEAGTVRGVMCTLIETTSRVIAERQAAATAAEIAAITDTLPALISTVDRDRICRFANRAHLDWLGRAPADLVGRPVREIVGETLFAERMPALDRAFAGEEAIFETRLPERGGIERRVEVHYVPRRGLDGRVEAVVGVTFDIEERARRAEALHLSNARFRRAMDAIHGVLWTNTPDGRMEGEQPGWAALTGQSQDEYRGHGWTRAIHPDDLDATLAAWNAAVRSGSMLVHEHRVRSRDGRWRTFAIRALPILDARGAVGEWVGVHTDITHRRAAEAALRVQAEELSREVRHRERAEVQLRQINETLEARVIAEIGERRAAEAKLLQSQKMEAIGKLTGGVAHDFNNLLQIVSGNLQLLSRELQGNETAQARLTNAMAGVARGAKLAAQLLAFGRRQALDPRAVNIARLLHGMDDLLHRAIGEAVEVETVVGAGLWNTFIDRAQLENAVLNLAINARDAMEGSGKLTIDLANAWLDDGYAERHDEVTPGQYVMLAVSDTGCGMTQEVMDRVFEPFFTTKGEGKGSGLGLPMVYGFVKQSGGHVKIYSEPGHGTTIRLYLPRALEAEGVEVVPLSNGPAEGGTETVLVVEDDAEVRAVVAEMLADLGYRVLKAADAQAALAIIESGIAIDLLFTDVVMPGTLKSPELARRARERIPGLAVLFTSGYTENSIIHGGRLDADVELLSKPYTREALARKLRHVLANAAQRRGPASPAPAPTPTPAATARRILVVEDDALIRMATEDMLEEAGHAVTGAGSAEAALALLEAGPCDVLLTDVNLPGMSGPELADRARALHPGLAVIFATGDSTGIAPAPRTAVLTKPYDDRALADAIARTL